MVALFFGYHAGRAVCFVRAVCGFGGAWAYRERAGRASLRLVRCGKCPRCALMHPVFGPVSCGTGIQPASVASCPLTIRSSRTCFVPAKHGNKILPCFASTTQVGLTQALGGTPARLQWFLASVMSAAFAELCFAVGRRSRCSSDTALGARLVSCVPSAASVRRGLAESERVGRCLGSCIAASVQGARTCNRSSGVFFQSWHPTRVSGIVPPNNSFKPKPLRGFGSFLPQPVGG